MIDYAEAKRQSPKLKAKITRARKSGDPMKAVIAVAENILAWDEIGCWPDNWSEWQRALDDVFGFPAGPSVDDVATQVRVYGMAGAERYAREYGAY